MRQFFSVLDGFRKLNLFHLIPDISQADYSVLKMTQYCAEGMADVRKNVKVSSVVEKLGCAAPMVSRSLKNLESRGWIVRVTDPDDRRNTFVYLTEEGNRMIQKADGTLYAFTSRVFQELGPEIMQSLNQNLLRFQQICREEMNRESKLRQNPENESDSDSESNHGKETEG